MTPLYQGRAVVLPKYNNCFIRHVRKEVPKPETTTYPRLRFTFRWVEP